MAEGEVCPCCRPSVVLGPKGEVIVIWRKVFPDGARDMASSVSADGGRSCQGPFRMAVDGWRIAGCPDAGVRDANHPSMAVTPEGRLLLVFEGRPAAPDGGWGRLRPWLVEVDGSGRPSAPLPIPVPAASPPSVRPVVAVGTVGRMFVAWTERTPAGTSVVLTRARRQAP
ncbi:MAG: hypothetical protein IPO09_20290 [Anaeromyxobacter sp.]|nr:hypothetical protein [Anaeromyxobacter sp.]MBL0274870.1 hypothetical protein [Anaeromyxobacter sp.]